MASLSHQSAINSERNFWLSAQNDNTIPYNTALKFDLNPDGSLQSRLLGSLSTMYIQSPTSVAFSIPNTTTAKAEINVDATAQNQLAGLYVSSPIATDTSLVTSGYSGTAMTMTQRDDNNNIVNNWATFVPKNSAGGVQPSTLQGFVYSAKDNFQFNALTSPIWTINPNIPRIDIPTYTINTSNIQVSSINGSSIPSGNRVIEFAQPVLITQAYPQAVTVGATVSNPGIVAGGLYQYDIGVEIVNATPNNAGSAPTYPYNVFFGVRLGGNGAFDYAHTFAIQSASGVGAGTYCFNLTGMTNAGTLNQNIDVVVYHAQVGTTVTLAFASPNDPLATIVRIE